MKQSNLYKHKNCTDTAIYIVTPHNEGVGNSYLIKWFNITNPSNWFAIDFDVVIIKPEDEKNWKIIG